MQGEMKKDLWRYIICAVLFAIVFYYGPILHAYVLRNHNANDLRPLEKAYVFFGFMSALIMVALEYVASKKRNLVIVVNLSAMMMKFGMFIVFYLGLDDVHENIRHGMMIPMMYFLILQTTFIVIKLNQEDTAVLQVAQDSKSVWFLITWKFSGVLIELIMCILQLITYFCTKFWENQYFISW